MARYRHASLLAASRLQQWATVARCRRAPLLEASRSLRQEAARPGQRLAGSRRSCHLASPARTTKFLPFPAAGQERSFEIFVIKLNKFNYSIDSEFDIPVLFFFLFFSKNICFFFLFLFVCDLQNWTRDIFFIFATTTQQRNKASRTRKSSKNVEDSVS